MFNQDIIGHMLINTLNQPVQFVIRFSHSLMSFLTNLPPTLSIHPTLAVLIDKSLPAC